MIKQLLSTWTAEKNQRTKMQQAYFVTALLLTIISGVATLINVSFGRSMVMIAALIALVYFVNAIAWAVFDMIISRKLEQRLKADSSKKR